MRAALALAILLCATDAGALTPAICALPGNCTTAWSQQAVVNNIATGTNQNLYTGTGPCSIGADCYTNPAPNGIPFNVYLEFADDATTPWTTAQKQMWVALFTALGSTQWFSQVAAMYPPTSVWGAQSTGASMTLTNCLSGSPAHCGDFTYTPGTTTTCPDISLPSDQYGIYIKLPSQPNVTGPGGLAGVNSTQSPNGHCVFAGQTISSPTPLCWGGLMASPFGTVNGFTQPGPGGTVVVSLATGAYADTAGITKRLYVEGGGWYSYSTIFSGLTSTTLTNVNSPVNAGLGASITAGSNIENSPSSLTPNGCVIDNQVNLAISELYAAITNFHGEGWAQYAPSLCPPGNSPGNFPSCSHEQCLNAATNGIPNNDFLQVGGTQVPTALSTTMFSTNYNFLLAGAWANSQVTSTPGLPAPSLGYCFGRRAYADFWTTPCRQNSDCPSVSGLCSGVAVGSHCLAPSCSDGVQNGFETGVDCGGWCNPCGLGVGCATMWDCASQIPFGGTLAYCVGGVCTSY